MLKRSALVGIARARLRRLNKERQAILETFPELRANRRKPLPERSQAFGHHRFELRPIRRVESQSKREAVRFPRLH